MSRDYVLNPGKKHFWVNLSKSRVKELSKDGRLVLNNPNANAKYEIPAYELLSAINLEDPNASYWRMWLQSPSSQPHLFAIQPVSTDGHSSGSASLLEATKFYVANSQSEDEEKLDTEPVEPLQVSTEPIAGGFEMEDELEGFIDRNWSSIPFFSKLEKAGRQLQAGDIGRMDFLAKDQSNGEFVVVELKRNRSREKALGQVQTYMGWVAENMAGGDLDRVRGVIICQEQDPALKYAVTTTRGRVSVLLYEVRFLLTPS